MDENCFYLFHNTPTIVSSFAGSISFRRFALGETSLR